MPTAPSYIGVAGVCAHCMRGNVDGDRNFCEKNIQTGACDLCVPKPLCRIVTEHEQVNTMVVRTTTTTYRATTTVGGKRYHNIDPLGGVMYSKNDAARTAAQLRTIGHDVVVRKVAGATRYNIFTSTDLKVGF